MKTKIMTVLLVMTALGLRAQDYNPLVEEGKRWNVVFSLEGPSPTPQHYTTTSYKIMGDTLLDGTSYKKLYSTNREDLSNWQLQGVLRETETKQVFIKDYANHTFEGQERLLYDFSMQLGESICYYGESCCLTLVSICDTVFEEDGKTYKKHVLEYYEEGMPLGFYETWIEGIGSELGLLNSGSLFLVGGRYNLLCYYEDEDLIWQNPDFNSCYMGTDGVEENSAKTWISIHPNPTTGMIVVSGKNLKQVEVVNILGQRMATAQGKDETLQIDIANLPSGVYFVDITDSKGRKCVRKVVKE